MENPKIMLDRSRAELLLKKVGQQFLTATLFKSHFVHSTIVKDMRFCFFNASGKSINFGPDVASDTSDRCNSTFAGNIGSFFTHLV